MIPTRGNKASHYPRQGLRLRMVCASLGNAEDGINRSARKVRLNDPVALSYSL